MPLHVELGGSYGIAPGYGLSHAVEQMLQSVTELASFLRVQPLDSISYGEFFQGGPNLQTIPNLFPV